MKRVIPSLVVALFTTLCLQAQEEIKVKIKEKKFYDTQAIAYVVEIPQADFKTVQKQWAKYLKTNLKEKLIEENGQFMINNKYLPKISPDSIHINSYLKDYSGLVVLSASFKLNGQYISDLMDDDIHYPTKNYIRSFAVAQYQKAVKEELDEEKRKYDKLENQYQALLKENDSDHDAIKLKKREIVKLKDQITLNELDQSSKVLQIQAQKELVYKLVNDPGDAQKDAEKKLKQQEKEFKQLQNKKESLNSKIDGLEAQIRDKERAIVKNESEQKLKKLEIGDQEYIMQKVKKKLENIN